MSPWPNTELTDRLGICYPIIQAPMASASTPELAIAVSTAGGLDSSAILNRPTKIKISRR
jgi:nitronate monooxygenase